MSKENTPNVLWEPFVNVPGTKNERAVRYGHLEQFVKVLSGKILTIIDASTSDPRQNKALKDLVRNEVRTILFTYQDACLGHQQSIPDKELEFNR